MLYFYRQLAIALAKYPIVLATVTQATEFSSDPVGTKLFICQDGQLIGKIGGNKTQAEIRTVALQVLASNTKQFIEINLFNDLDRETQGEDGGTIRIWLERWDKTLLPLVKQIIMILETGQIGALVTRFDQPPYLLTETVDTPQFTTNGCLIEPLEPLPTLFIVGAGQVATSLALIAHLAEFQVIVTTPSHQFSEAIRVIPSLSQALKIIPTRSCYVVLATSGIQQDLEALNVLLTHPIHYLALVGGSNRIQKVLESLTQNNQANLLDKIQTQIGLDREARSPTEIAISICAELIQIRRQKQQKLISSTVLRLD